VGCTKVDGPGGGVHPGTLDSAPSRQPRPAAGSCRWDKIRYLHQTAGQWTSHMQEAQTCGANQVLGWSSSVDQCQKEQPSSFSPWTGMTCPQTHRAAVATHQRVWGLDAATGTSFLPAQAARHEPPLGCGVRTGSVVRRAGCGRYPAATPTPISRTADCRGVKACAHSSR